MLYNRTNFICVNDVDISTYSDKLSKIINIFVKDKFVFINNFNHNIRQTFVIVPSIGLEILSYNKSTINVFHFDNTLHDINTIDQLQNFAIDLKENQIINMIIRFVRDLQINITRMIFDDDDLVIEFVNSKFEEHSKIIVRININNMLMRTFQYGSKIPNELPIMNLKNPNALNILKNVRISHL